ncbi:MAG TPA: L-serine ammonia-lyase, iron-sulfur-dependent, subunit beta [Microscillaceae bacterium]|nr:L-serine ammonia-lyase, iron-sulfur-dependent, subunit beta [Microscillaceae bacterium]
MTQKSSIFDMIGPVMIGPSSSHTAGVVKIALVAHSFLGGIPESVTITFYNSFARTYEGHGSDKAVIGGLLGFRTDDARIKNALDEAEKTGLEFFFKSVGNASTMHPNTVKIQAKRENLEVEIIGESLGGGVINIAGYNGFRADFSASMHTLVIKNQDVPGSIAFIAQVLAQDGCNIATMNVSRKGKNDMACQFIEMDSEVAPITIEYLRHLEWIHDVIYIPYAK